MDDDWFIENVDFFEVWRDQDTMHLKFMDMFDDGIEYMLPLVDAEFLRDTLTRLLLDPDLSGGE